MASKLNGGRDGESRKLQSNKKIQMRAWEQALFAARKHLRLAASLKWRHCNSGTLAVRT